MSVKSILTSDLRMPTFGKKGPADAGAATETPTDAAVEGAVSNPADPGAQPVPPQPATAPTSPAPAAGEAVQAPVEAQTPPVAAEPVPFAAEPEPAAATSDALHAPASEIVQPPAAVPTESDFGTATPQAVAAESTADAFDADADERSGAPLANESAEAKPVGTNSPAPAVGDASFSPYVAPPVSPEVSDGSAEESTTSPLHAGPMADAGRATDTGPENSGTDARHAGREGEFAAGPFAPDPAPAEQGFSANLPATEPRPAAADADVAPALPADDGTGWQRDVPEQESQVGSPPPPSAALGSGSRVGEPAEQQSALDPAGSADFSAPGAAPAVGEPLSNAAGQIGDAPAATGADERDGDIDLFGENAKPWSPARSVDTQRAADPSPATNVPAAELPGVPGVVPTPDATPEAAPVASSAADVEDTPVGEQPMPVATEPQLSPVDVPGELAAPAAVNPQHVDAPAPEAAPVAPSADVEPVVQVGRSPVPPVRRLSEPDVAMDAEDLTISRAPLVPAASAAPEPAAALPAAPRRGLSRAISLRSRGAGAGPPAVTEPPKQARKGINRSLSLPKRRSKVSGQPVAAAAATAAPASRRSRFSLNSSIGVTALRRGRSGKAPNAESPAKKKSLSRPSLGSLRGLQLSVPSRNKDGGHLVGLDIEPGFAVAVRGAKHALCAEKAISIPLPAGVVREGEVVDSEALALALRAMFDGSDLSRRVRVGVAGQRCVMRTLELPPLSDKRELAQAVAFTAAKEMPMPLERAVTDFQALGQVETPGGPRERVVFVAAHREPVDKLLDALRKAGLTAGALDLSAFALIRALHDPADGEEPRGCTLYLNVDGLTNIAIADDATCLFTRVAAVGIESMAAELAGARSITLEDARVALVKCDLREPADEDSSDLRTILRDGARDVASEVRTALDFHGSQQDGKAVTRIVLSGGVAQVGGFDSELGQTLGFDVTVREVAAADATFTSIAPCRMAVAAGLSVAEVPR